MASLKEKESEKWFKDVLKRQVSKKASETYDKTRKRIKPGEILTFNYHAKGSLKVLKFYDRHPVSLIFAIKGKYMWGISLHYLPRPARLLVLKQAIKLNKLRIKSNLRMDLNYEMLKDFLHRQGIAEFTIKKYIKGRMSKVEYVKYKDWKYVSSLNSAKFVFGEGYSQDDLIKYIRRHQAKTKQSKNKRHGR